MVGTLRPEITLAGVDLGLEVVSTNRRLVARVVTQGFGMARRPPVTGTSV